MHENLDKLIPELPLWNNGAGIDPESWVNSFARCDHAAGYALLFWPDFVLYDDCVFLSQPDPQHYADWLSSCHGDKTRVEGLMNHQHILDMFCNSEMKPTKELVAHIGRLLKDMWSCKLKRDFPDRPIRVECYGDDSDDLIDYQITVFHDRGEAL
ncbi:MAG: hypothetical protein NTW86_25565 [Candidatus Sumerlaeota bacterium]|nr:hypothetical protein [Candidatus Sumerlaeota bacterium]